MHSTVFALKASLLAAAVAVISGCVTTQYAAAREREFDWVGQIAAPVLYESIKSVISKLTPPLSIEVSIPGELQTSWITVPGKQTGILWWQREWEARVQHTIRVRPDFVDPSKRSGFIVLTRAEERPNPNYPWTQADREIAEKAAELLRSNLIRKVEEIDNSKETK